MDSQHKMGRRAMFRTGGAGLLAIAIPVNAGSAEAASPVLIHTPVWLFDTHVAGTHYYDCEDVLPLIEVGTSLVLRREPGNSHDELAIEIFVEDGRKLGYVPRRLNTALSRLLEAGWRGQANVASIDDSRWNPVMASISVAAPNSLASAAHAVRDQIRRTRG